jgi:hypothetical protein
MHTLLHTPIVTAKLITTGRQTLQLQKKSHQLDIYRSGGINDKGALNPVINWILHSQHLTKYPRQNRQHCERHLVKRH